jgi:endonuclease/exonuclease/phosphatase family metal-dependent hydrolase
MKLNAIYARFLLSVIVGLPMVQSGYANESERQVKVMTYNMYLGTDVGEIFGSQSVEELLSEVGEAYITVQAGDPSERIDKIADAIVSASPDVVGLQEVALWRYGYPGDPAAAETVGYDFLELLLEKLKDRGAHYAAISVQTNLDAELTGFFGPETFLDVRYTDRDVIIARTDLQTSELKIDGTSAGAFQTLLPISILNGPPVSVTRGWNSADIKHRGKTYRFINTHLESFSDLVQYYQALELLSGPANTETPVILVGDLNTDSAINPNTYSLLLGKGFSDAWSDGPNAAGFTWPLSGEDPLTILTPSQRIDYVLARGPVALSQIEVVGEDPTLDLTPFLRRPSDHAGLVANILLESNPF